jgi:hypothetical protein
MAASFKMVETAEELIVEKTSFLTCHFCSTDFRYIFFASASESPQRSDCAQRPGLTQVPTHPEPLRRVRRYKRLFFFG